MDLVSLDPIYGPYGAYGLHRAHAPYKENRIIGRQGVSLWWDKAVDIYVVSRAE